MCPWKYTFFEEIYLPRLISFKGNFPGHKRFQPNGSPLNSTCVSETIAEDKTDYLFSRIYF
jgi:hypothetical protein